MIRTPSHAAQLLSGLSNRVSKVSFNSAFPVRLAARAAREVMRPLTAFLGRNRTVVALLYGRSLIVPAEHPLSDILAGSPQYNRPLASAARAIASLTTVEGHLAIIDVGANVGETIAIIEEALPDVSVYLCVEADPSIAHLCALNYAGNERVEVKQCFIGEDEGAAVKLEDDGRANPSVRKLASQTKQSTTQVERLVRLDTIATSFAETNGRVDLIKVDTEGYDFAVLRSASQIIDRFKPAFYFEWFPKALKDAGQEVHGDFARMQSGGYRHFVFFTSRGDYYCHVSDPDVLFLKALSVKAEAEGDYLDVFSSTQKLLCEKLVEFSITDMLDRAAKNPRRRYLV